MAIRRWRRYGKDRLYVTDGANNRLGWHDLLTGQTSYDDPTTTFVVDEEVAEWRLREAGTAREPELRSAPSPHPSPEARSKPIDLAINRPGTAPAARAKELQQTAPVRTFFARILDLKTDERAWRVGAKGEQHVGDKLDKFAHQDSRWHVLHSVPVGDGDSDIDHVVIGPGGVFTLNTKHHPGGRIWVRDNAFRVNNTSRPYLHASRHEAARASRLLSEAAELPILVTAVIVVVGASQLRVVTQPDDVVVLNEQQVVPWLQTRPRNLTDGTVASLFAHARHQRLWQP